MKSIQAVEVLVTFKAKNEEVLHEIRIQESNLEKAALTYR